MASIYNQSTQTGTGRFAPSVQYSAVVKTPKIGDIEIPKMSESESINIDLQPIANAFMNSEANETKLKMAELEHEFNLRKLEAEKEKKKAEGKDYETLRSFALGLSDLEASAKNLTPMEYQARYKNLLDSHIMMYKGNPKDVANLASSVGWGNKEEIIANRKDQSAWEQDQRQGRVEELAKNNAWLRGMDPSNQAYVVDRLNQTLATINQATATENDPNATEADKEIAKQTKQQSAITLAATVWQGAIGSGEIDPNTFSNEANYLTAMDLVAKRISAATGMTYGPAKLAAQMGGDLVGITDMTNDSMKKFAANKQYAEDNNKYVEALQKAQLYRIPAVRLLESLSPELRDRMLNDPTNRAFYDGIIKQYLMDFSFDETNGDATVKLLGGVEKLTNAQANEQPSVSLGRQHAMTYLDIAKDQVMMGNRNLNRSPYADYYWYMGMNGIQATLAQQAISAQSAEDLNTVATNVNNASKLIANPTAQAKKASIEANNANNPIATDMVKADKDFNTIIGGAMTLKNKLPEKDINSLLQNANYFRTSLIANLLRLDEKTGEVKVLENAKGVLETIGSINEANIFLNVKDFNNKMSNIKNINDRIAMVKYLTATPSNGIIKSLQEGDVVQDEAGVLSTVLTDIATLIGVGIDQTAQILEYVRKKQVEPRRQSSANAELIEQPTSNVRNVNNIAETSTETDEPVQLTPAMDSPVQSKQKPMDLDKKLHMNVIGDQTFITYTDEEEGLQYDFNTETKQEVFMVDDVMYVGTIPLKDTKFTGIKKREEDDGIVLVSTDPSITGTYGWYTDGHAEKMKTGIEKLYEGIKRGQ